MKRILREHAPFLVCFGGLLLYFLWPVILLKSSFVLGDYGVQFYPWSFFYSQLLKQGQLPYWTDLLSGGFPLVSEGQFGPYYLLHQFLYRVLPFEAAYSWGIVLHFLLGGTGFYLYSRRIGLSRWAGALSAVLFSFSSAYGGCFYNTVTQRALTWLPWAMWVLECLRQSRGPKAAIRWTLILAALISQMWTAGFPQMALYAVGYLGLLSLFISENRVKLFWVWLAAGILAILLALPQLMPTVELARISTRAGETADFALWGSVLPFSPVSLVYPEWGNFLRVSFYIGILPLFFFLFELSSKVKTAASRAHLWLALIFLLLAFGKYNPLYSALIQTFSLTALRNPSKFLFFTTLSMAVAAGFGMDRWLKAADGDQKDRSFHKFIAAAGVVMMAMPLAAWVFMKYTYTYWEAKIPTIAAAIHSGKTEPSKPLEAYAGVLGEMLTRSQALFAPNNKHQWVTVIFVLASAALLLSAKAAKNIPRNRLPTLALALVSLNLIVFANYFGTGFLGNIARLEPLERSSRGNQATKLLPPGTCIAERVTLRDEEWFDPSKNLLYGLPHAGGYSPLLVRRHYELTRELGFVDASLGRLSFSDEVWRREKNLIDFLGVGLLISETSFENEGWRRLGDVEGRPAYQNETVLPIFYGVSRQRVIQGRSERLSHLKSKDFLPREEVVLESPIAFKEGTVFSAPERVDRTSRGVSGSIAMREDGILVSRIVDIPGVRMELDGFPAAHIRVNHAFCGIFLPKGSHEIRIFYDASREHLWERAALFFWVITALTLLLSLPRRRPKLTTSD